MEEAECKSEFRVEKRDIPLLAEALGLPDTFTCPQRSVADGIEGLCMVPKRTSFPCRYSDMIYRFGRPVPVLSMVTNQVVDYIYQTNNSHSSHDYFGATYKNTNIFYSNLVNELTQNSREDEHSELACLLMFDL